jgi:hypothetical protein
MDLILKEESWKFVIPYLDDIIIFSKNKTEHQKHLEIILGKLKAADIALNESKCKFFKEEVKLLGSIVSKGKIKPDPTKISAILEYTRPETIKQLRSFLGMANYIREFIPKFAETASPLTELLKGKCERSEKQIYWTDDGIKAFERLRDEIAKVAYRTQPDLNKDFILITDASSIAIGAVLTQKDSRDKEQMIAAYSYKLNSAECNYSTTDKELLAVVKGIEHFRHYLAGREFELRTDHQALEYMKTTQNSTSRLLRWALKLEEYKFKVRYIKGETNIADGLSRPILEKTKINATTVQEFTEENKKEILKTYHIETGHGSSNTMKDAMRRKYNWTNMFKDIEEYQKACLTCLKAGEQKINTKNQIVSANGPNDLWEIDLIGRIPGINGTNKFIFIAIDHYTKWIETSIMTRKDSKSTAQLIKELILEKHGIPRRIWTDNGLEFNNTEVKNLIKENNILFTFSSPNHHQTVGAVERVNQTLINKLKTIGKGDLCS